jgi:hypothetical protein
MLQNCEVRKDKCERSSRNDRKFLLHFCQGPLCQSSKRTAAVCSITVALCIRVSKWTQAICEITMAHYYWYIYISIIYIYNRNWVDTRWQQYITHFSMDHILFHCEYNKVNREDFKKKIGTWPTSKPDLITKYQKEFCAFVETIDFDTLQKSTQ